MKILIAEDDTASRLVLGQFLRQLGYDVLATANGEEAWRAFEKETPPLVIIDWLMPGFDGIELCRRIRDAQRSEYTYIILLTVLEGKGKYLEAINAGADDFISKPYDPELLHARLRVAERILDLRGELTQLERNIQQERLRALGEMALGVAHDVNNALSAVVSYSDLLLENPGYLDDKERVTEYLRLMLKGALDASQMARRLRGFSRPRHEGEVFSPIDVNRVVTTALAMTEPRWRGQAQASGGTIAVETALGQIPLVDGNEPELREVLVNLILNAVDAMPQGGSLTLRTGTRDEGVFIEVSDTGCGMTEEVRRRCLEPFFTTKGDRGTGLGLAMAFGIIRRHEGSIQVQSQPGAGTTFVIRLPISKELAEADSVRETNVASRSLRVLVVDDEPVPLGVTAELLTSDGHTVETATGGRDGLAKFQESWFDVVVTDLAMPEINGAELASTIKRIAPRKPIVILLTGFPEVAMPSGERPAGVDVVITKPVTISKLREALAIAT